MSSVARHSPWTIAFVVSIATFMEVLDTTITNVSLSHIGGTLGASQNESTWVLTSYLVANGIVLPLSGWLSNALGRKRFFMLCIGGFTAASFACGAATSLTMLVIFRLIQGLAGGGLQPTQQAIILDAFPPEKRGSVFAITGITLIAAPIIGPTLGGWITDNFTWRWIFYINVPVGIAAFMLVGMVVHEPIKAALSKVKPSIDYIGLLLIATGIGCLQMCLDKGEQEDWLESDYIVILASISIITLLTAFFWLRRQADPIVDINLLKDRRFGMSCILIFFTGFTLYAGSALLPLLLQTQYGYDATLAGLVLSPGGLTVIFLMPIVGKLIGRVQVRYLITTGLLLCMTGMYFTMRLTPQTDYATFTLMRILQVTGLPFLFIPISTMAFMNIPPGKNNKASAIFALCRNLGGSVGIAIIATFVSRHQQLHQNFLSTHLTPGEPVYQGMLSHYKHMIRDQGVGTINTLHQTMGKLYGILQQQASILAYQDAFEFLAMVMLSLAVLTVFLPGNNPRTGRGHGGGH